MRTPPAYIGGSLPPISRSNKLELGILILGMASRLDAFSGYPKPT